MTLTNPRKIVQDYTGALRAQAQIFAQFTAASDDPIDIIDFQRELESLQIATKSEGRKPLIINRSQEKIWHMWLEAREKRIPARFICCKARQLGVSTLLLAMIFLLLVKQAWKNGYATVQDGKAGVDLFRRPKMFYRFMPPEWKKTYPLLSDTKQQLVFDMPHGSTFTVETANKETLGSSRTLQYVLCSEVAKYEDPPATDGLVSLHQCVPQHWNTLIFWESTAFGAYDLFHRTWLQAEAGKSDFIPIFLTWKGFPEYFIPVNPSYKPEFDQTELDYQAKYELSDEEMLWAQTQRRTKCFGDWDEFNQEYPVVADLAFKSSGHPWFNPESLEKLAKGQKQPIRRGQFKFASEVDPILEWEELPDGIVEIWEDYDERYEYVMAVDTAEGVKADYSVGWVLKCPRLAMEPTIQVAKFRTNRMPGEDIGVVAFQVGLYYGRAFTAVERNRGLNTLVILERGDIRYPQTRKGYPNLYYHTPIDKKVEEETIRLGWLTTKTTKSTMLQHFQQVVYDGGLILHSANSLYEMRGFAYDPRHGKYIQKNPDEQTKLCHDDEVMAGGIALQMIHYSKSNRFTGKIRDGGW